MRQRCTNPRHSVYVSYGARGIRVCPEWEDFSTLLRDMGPRPRPQQRLVRIDEARAYEPGSGLRAIPAEHRRRMRQAQRAVTERATTTAPGITRGPLQPSGAPAETVATNAEISASERGNQAGNECVGVATAEDRATRDRILTYGVTAAYGRA
jgi:hypothetical protein